AGTGGDTEGAQGWQPRSLTLLELLEQRVEARVIEDAVERAAVEAGDGLQRGAVIGVDKGQVLDEEQVDDVVAPVALVDRDARVAGAKDLGDGGEIQHSVGAQHEAVGQRRQHVLHHLGAQLQRSLHHGQLLPHQVAVGPGGAQRLQQPLPRGEDAELLPERPVQQPAERVAQREGGQHQQPREAQRARRDGQPVPRAHRVGQHLAAQEDGGRAQQHGQPRRSTRPSAGRRPSAGQRRAQPAGQRRVGPRLAQQQRAQQPCRIEVEPFRSRSDHLQQPLPQAVARQRSKSLDKLYNFADCSGLHLIFALNALRRNPNNSWNSSNALSLLKYSASKKYNISWELGNEPNNYRTLIGRSVNGSQLGKDYIQLRSLLQLIRTYSRANLYGPNIGRPRKNVMALLEGFMKVAGSTVDAVTWQHYYIDGRVAKVTDFLKTRLLDTLSDQIRKIQKVVNAYTPGKKIWLEGVGATSAGGMNNLSDSYAAGFLWLNTLGLLASQGIDVVVRHSFLDHGHNHLVDQNFNPLPDYWLSLLYKRLIGPKVLAIHVAGLQRKPRPGRVIRDKLRIYAHCTSSHNHNYVRGSITLYIINLHRSRKKIKLAGTLRDKIVHQYLLQPYGKDGLHSKSVQLNGQPLAMVDDGTLPELKPRPLRAGRTLVIPPLTMSFYVVKNVNALACRYR
uniref:Heparanase 2 (inactive) n=1 Tax=Gallus gallus TaxID=9031 RepID=A0A8V0Z721_CHICK